MTVEEQFHLELGILDQVARPSPVSHQRRVERHAVAVEPAGAAEGRAPERAEVVAAGERCIPNPRRRRCPGIAHPVEPLGRNSTRTERIVHAA